MGIQGIEVKIPLVKGDEDVVLVKGTRIPLDTLVYLYRAGATPEAMAERFPSLDLATVYLLLAYYLNHKEEVDSYLVKREAFRNTLRSEIESNSDMKGIRERLLARRKEHI